MGSCTIMPMIPTAWFSSGNFRAAIHAMTFVTCTPVQTFGGWVRAFSRKTVGIMQGKLLWLYREGGSSDFSGIPKHMGER